MVTICQECGAANTLPATECRACGMPLGTTDHATGEHTQVFVPPPADVFDQPEIAQGPTGEPPPPPPPDTVVLTTKSYTSGTVTDTPVGLAIHFPRILFGGHTGQIMVQVANNTAQPIDQIEITLESRGFSSPASARLDRLPARQTLCATLEVELARPGNFVLQCYAKIQSEGQVKSFIAARILKINNAPENPAALLNPHSLHLNNEVEDSVEARRPVTPATTLLRSGKSAPFSELLALKLPEEFQPLELSLDYQLSVSAVDISKSQRAQSLLIPRLFLGYVQNGTALKLTPVEADKHRGVHLVARPQFKLGRSRAEADFITWFWPRSPLNDERTRHLSKLHTIAQLQGQTPSLRDGGSIGGSAFDGNPLSSQAWEPIKRRGVLALSAEYFLDVHPLDSVCDGLPAIKNIRLWNGPDLPPNPVRGCIRFDPLKTQLALFNAVWLFTDAAFGSSRSNGVVLESSGLEEIQGSFHYYRGCFWLENRVSNDAVRINYHVLNANEIAPLISGQILQLGPVSYHVEVCA
ncbi:MAG: hypothetical protein AB1705_22280 [Verrucomicrobiota bacterium]